MIKVGTSEITGITIGTTTMLAVHVGTTQVFPTNITHTLTDISLSYNTGTYLKPNRSNRATITGTWKTFKDGVLVSSEIVTCNPIKVTPTNPILINAWQIEWDRPNYGTTVVSQTNCPVKAEYNGITASTTLTVVAGANSRTTNTRTTSYVPDGLGTITYSGGTYTVEGFRHYDWWDTYTSTATGNTGSSTSYVAATSYSNPSQSWLAGGSNIAVYANTAAGAAGNRSATIRAYYDGYYGVVDISQWGAPTITYTYTLNSVGIQPTSVAYNAYGSSNYATAWIYVQYVTKTWKDGVTTTSAVQDFTGDTGTYNAVADNSNFELQDINYTHTGSEVPLTWTLNHGISGKSGHWLGIVHAYAKTQNTGINSRTTDIEMNSRAGSDSVVLTQNGAPATLTISPTSWSTTYYSATTNVTVTTNVGGLWTVESSASWITATKTTDAKAKINAAYNSGDTRTGYVYFKYNGTTYATLTVSQTGSVTPFVPTGIQSAYKTFAVYTQDSSYAQAVAPISQQSFTSLAGKEFSYIDCISALGVAGTGNPYGVPIEMAVFDTNSYNPSSWDDCYASVSTTLDSSGIAYGLTDLYGPNNQIGYNKIGLAIRLYSNNTWYYLKLWNSNLDWSTSFQITTF